ncbi:hypothetical protein C5167_017834 [Papaver somniferum]|uniref:Uncharacterized protein n=1 Tax=Papaver somniferum TaxID=3469 RepID=A0A4Y7IKJ5_PAPSO|nr:hypothetical protein C5167_017834 [Papaver somniferum]
MYCLPRAKQWEKDFTIHAVCHRIDEYRGRYCSSTHLSQASTRKAKNNCIKVNEIRVKTILDFKLWSEKAQIQ